MSFYDKHMTRMMFWRKVVALLWSRRDFISPRYPCEQVLQSSGFRLIIWNWLCFSLSVHVMMSATDTSNALCKLQLQKIDAFTVAPTTEWHDCLSRISVREMPKLYILTFYLYFVYREETFVFHIGAWVSEFECHIQRYMWRHIYVQANRRRRATFLQLFRETALFQSPLRRA